MSAAPIPPAGVVLFGPWSIGWSCNWPIMGVVAEIPRWRDFPSLLPVPTVIATVLPPARPTA